MRVMFLVPRGNTTIRILKYHCVSCNYKIKTVPLALPHTGFSLLEELDVSPPTSDKTGYIQ